jgi:hypothetical protein
MKSNIRHTFRPTLDVLEDRLVPSWSLGAGGGAVAVLTAAQPAAGWDIGKHVPPAAQLATESPPAVGLTLPDGPTTVLSVGAGAGKAKLDAPTMAARFSEIVVTKTEDDIVLRRVRDLTTPAGPSTVVTPAPLEYLKVTFGPALPTENVTLNFTKVE